MVTKKKINRRAQPYRLDWEGTPASIEEMSARLARFWDDADEMFQILFDDLQATDVTVNEAKATPVVSSGPIIFLDPSSGAGGGGEDGEQGPPGPMGPRGPQGPTGASSTGIPGPPGMDGLDGQDGEDGISIPGPQGSIGATGSTGPAGIAGPPGLDGAPGEDGADGISIPGPQGSIGATGPTGPTGAGGPMGPPGAIGEPGDDGLDGISVPGPQGPIGATGPQGIQGIQGYMGPPGLDGLDGADGLDGVSVPGPQGSIGATGPQGIQGIQGYIGPPGASGEEGADGYDGVSVPGPQGAQGVTGATGPTGPTGAVGPMGLTGEPGDDGLDSLIPGPQGIQGPTGPTGPPGSSSSGMAQPPGFLEVAPDEYVEPLLTPNKNDTSNGLFGGSLAEPRTISTPKTILGNTSEVIVGPVTVLSGQTITFQDANSKLQILGGAPTPFFRFPTLGTDISESSGSVTPSSLFSGKWCGLNKQFTPTQSGKVLITICGGLLGSSAASFTLYSQIGRGTPPVNGADFNFQAFIQVLSVPLPKLTFSEPTALGVNFPFSMTLYIEVEPKITYWVDMACFGNPIGGTVSFDLFTCIVEIP